MTDYANRKAQELAKRKRLDKTPDLTIVDRQSERSELVSKNFDNDETLKKYYQFKNTFRPRLIPKDPKTFCFFSSAEMRYNNALHNIINYYPFDGTQQEHLDWQTSSAPLEVALVEKHWPSSVGHIQFNNREYIRFFAGPQKIQGSEYTGKFVKGEPAIKIDYTKGNTAEFWLKKDTGSNGWISTDPETVFDIGSHPQHVESSDIAKFKVTLQKRSDLESPFSVTYKLGSTGIDSERIGTGSLSTTAVADGNWHHYAFRAHQSGSKMYVDLFVDGKRNHTIESALGSTLEAQESYMAGAIGAPLNSSLGTLTGSIDEFRFWKGQRTNRQINRYYDQKVYASDIEESDYINRLGVYYKFNKVILGDSSMDSIVIDYSGNDMTGKVSNYQSNTRSQTSAIDASSSSSNTEIPDLSLLESDSRVSSLRTELLGIARSYDKNNHNSIMKMIPDWANDPHGNHDSNRKSDFYILLNMISEEFDEIKLNVDSIKFLSNRNFDSSYSTLGATQQQKNTITNTDQAGLFQCSDKVNDLDIWPGNRIDFPKKNLEKLGFKIDVLPLDLNIKPEDDFENILGNIRLSIHPSDVKSLILDNVLIAANSILKKKGTERSFEQLMSCWGIDSKLISFNVYGQNSEIDLDQEYKRTEQLKVMSYDFTHEPESVLYMSSNGEQATAEIDYIKGSSGDLVKESNMTLEGNFIFPEKSDTDEFLKSSSVFGLKTINTGHTRFSVSTSGTAFSFQVNARKLEGNPKAAKFEITSSAGTVETDYIENIYDNSRWNLSVRVQRVGNADQRFLTGSTMGGGTPGQENRYQIVFSGHNYILESLQNTFTKTIDLTSDQYTNFMNSNKTVFVGADLQNVKAGTVNNKSDFKFINLKGWNAALEDEEIKDLSQNIHNWGRKNNTQWSSGYQTFENGTDAYNTLNTNRLMFRIDTPFQKEVPSDGVLKIFDFTSGSVSKTESYGGILGSKYPFSSTVVSSESRSKILNVEYIPVPKSQPLELVRTSEEVKVKDSELDKFKVNIQEESKIISLEKSMYRQISEEMINFLSGMKSFNNLIGEPINKYRQNYKLLSHFRQKFFENVENENQFERYVEYYRWIDYSLGRLLEQIVPATGTSNTGLHSVVESHILERNKYEHRAPLMKQITKQVFESPARSTGNTPRWVGPEEASEQDSAIRMITDGNNRENDNGTARDPSSEWRTGKLPIG